MNFIRRDYKRYSKIGKNRKKLQKWRRPNGRDNKIRENRKGYPTLVKIGFKSPRKTAGRIKGLLPCRVFNFKDLESAGKDKMIIIGKVGAKKKIEIIKKANEMNLKIFNVVKEKKNEVR
ncbi:MAG: eL32 family ribosomal protein [Candidatus Pacearchaeota archaeon]|nr:eL32 family ribosomal protein [Candidatus Pacearchaeota archaeon]